MIARIWRGEAEVAHAGAYQSHFTATVAPQLKQLAGHRGAYLLRRETAGKIEFLAVTLWQSIDAIRQFTGPDPTIAVVEPEGRAALTAFDDTARHYEVCYDNVD